MEVSFKKALVVIEKLHQHGFEAYFVGGSVRDYLLNRSISDVDIATSALPTDVMKLFDKTVDVGAQHGTVIVIIDKIQYEVTTFRTEEGYLDYRRPESVSFVTSLYEDLRRRDFTMNAIAMTASGDLIDPFDGKAALEKKVIQTVGSPDERFNEDALRMMRALRFASQLGFALEAKTLKAIEKYGYLLANISVERMTIEFEKLLKGAYCNDAVSLLVQTRIYSYLPGLDLYEEDLKELGRYDWSSIRNQNERWTLLVSLLKLSSIETFLRRWKLPKKVIKSVKRNIKILDIVMKSGWTRELLYTTDYSATFEIETVRSILTFENVSKNLSYIEDELDLLPIKDRSELAISGEDLLSWYGKGPGEWVAELISIVEHGVIHKQVENDKLKIREWLQHCNLK